MLLPATGVVEELAQDEESGEPSDVAVLGPGIGNRPGGCSTVFHQLFWGESVSFGADNTFAVTMVFQGLDRSQAEDIWRPFMDWVAASPNEFIVTARLAVGAIPAQEWWNAEYLKRSSAQGRGFFDERPGAPTNNVWFAEQNTELGAFIHGYQSLWLPASLLREDRRSRFRLTLSGCQSPH